jgi:hypothetical protein
VLEQLGEAQAQVAQVLQELGLALVLALAL